MKRPILIVDDDPDMLQAVKAQVENADSSFFVHTAQDGLDALKQLETQAISVVVTDLKMPRMDGLELLVHIVEHYPDIPVIIITGYGVPPVKEKVEQVGAVGFIDKPFKTEQLVGVLQDVLKAQSEGGTLNQIASHTFLEMVVNVGRTCTLRLLDKSSGQQGALFMREGDLLDARFKNLRGIDAALEILSWKKVTLKIENSCPRKEKRITTAVNRLLELAKKQQDAADTRRHTSKHPDKDVAPSANLKVEAGSGAAPLPANPEAPELRPSIQTKQLASLTDGDTDGDLFGDPDNLELKEQVIHRLRKETAISGFAVYNQDDALIFEQPSPFIGSKTAPAFLFSRAGQLSKIGRIDGPHYIVIVTHKGHRFVVFTCQSLYIIAALKPGSQPAEVVRDYQ